MEETINLEKHAIAGRAASGCYAAPLGVRFSRAWAMPNRNTFDVPPIRALVRKYLSQSTISVDPFARNKRWATHTNDLNPDTAAEHHMEASEFLNMLAEKGVRADLIIFDPPYSPRQISECYKAIGLTVGMKETQSAAMYSSARDAIQRIAVDGAGVISFGWNTVGMGLNRGFELKEILLVCHGGAHNDTIVTVERKVASAQLSLIGEAT